MFVVSYWGLMRSHRYLHKQQFVSTALSCWCDSRSSYLRCMSRRLVACCNYLTLLSPKLLNNLVHVTSIQRVVSAFLRPQAFQTTFHSLTQLATRNNRFLLLSLLFSCNVCNSKCPFPAPPDFPQEWDYRGLKSFSQRSYFGSEPHNLGNVNFRWPKSTCKMTQATV